MEVQAHGNYYEDLKTRQITGLSKAEYDALKDNGYTSGMDIMKGLLSANDYSIKTTNGNRVDCGDILRRRQETRRHIPLGHRSTRRERCIEFQAKGHIHAGL